MASLRVAGRSSSWNCPKCRDVHNLRRQFSTSLPVCALGPESPRYIDVPESLQPQKYRKPIVKGSLPVPRDIFTRVRGGTKRVTKRYLDAATQDAKEPAGSSTTAQAQHNEFAKQMTELRKTNLREGLVALKERREKLQAVSKERTLRLQAERQKVLSQKEREDERLTSPSITQLMQSNRVNTGLADPNREQRIAEKIARVQQKAEAKAQHRQDALHALYMHARNFIVTDKQLDQAIESTFGSQEQPKTWNHRGMSIWANGPPPSVSTMLARASDAKPARAGDNDSRARITKDRMRRVAEELTGGKM